MGGFFPLEAAKQEIGIGEIVEGRLETACREYQETGPGIPLRIAVSEPETLWHKLDHLLYLPVLGLTRPRDVYYYQGEGLKVLYSFTYKYLTLEHFLGELTRLQVGCPLSDALACAYRAKPGIRGMPPCSSSPIGTSSRTGPNTRPTQATSRCGNG